MRNWMKLILADWDLRKGPLFVPDMDKFPPILLDPRLALPIPEAKKAKVIWWALKRYLRICNGCGPGWLNTHWLHGDWSNDDLYGCWLLCLPFLLSMIFHVQLLLEQNRFEYSTAKGLPSDRQTIKCFLRNSALRSELQVLGALQALLNLIRLHTPLTPGIDTSSTSMILNLLLADLQGSFLCVTSKIPPTDKPVFCELEDCPSQKNGHCDIVQAQKRLAMIPHWRRNIPPEGAFFSISSMSSTKYSILQRSEYHWQRNGEYWIMPSAYLPSPLFLACQAVDSSPCKAQRNHCFACFQRSQTEKKKSKTFLALAVASLVLSQWLSGDRSISVNYQWTIVNSPACTAWSADATMESNHGRPSPGWSPGRNQGISAAASHHVFLIYLDIMKYPGLLYISHRRIKQVGCEEVWSILG